MEIKEQLDIIKRGVIDLVSEEELIKKLKENRPLRVKFGADPSAPDLHLGHCVQLRALRKMQELGHMVMFLIGDFTGMIGDPSGRSATRPQLTPEDVAANAQTYLSQAGKILDMDKAEVYFNSDWISKLTSRDMIELAGKCTVAQLLEREDFAKRFAEQSPLGLHELFYPILQGYDSVALKADIEFGGSDQTFNLFMGRQLQKANDLSEQVIITRPLIPGTDGTKKMSKSLNNYIAVLDTPDDIFGKLMSIPDHLIPMYLEYLTDVPMAEIAQMDAEMKSGTLNPRDAKERLALEIIGYLYDSAAAANAASTFRSTFSGRGGTLEDLRNAAEIIELDSDIFANDIPLANLICNIGLTTSSGEARRLIKQGAVYINEDKITDEQYKFTPEVDQLIRAGKRRLAILSEKK